MHRDTSETPKIWAPLVWDAIPLARTNYVNSDQINRGFITIVNSITVWGVYSHICLYKYRGTTREYWFNTNSDPKLPVCVMTSFELHNHGRDYANRGSTTRLTSQQGHGHDRSRQSRTEFRTKAGTPCNCPHHCEKEV